EHRRPVQLGGEGEDHRRPERGRSPLPPVLPHLRAHPERRPVANVADLRPRPPPARRHGPRELRGTTMTAIALVTGSASGIGRAVTARLYASGRTIVATDVNAAGLQQAAADGGWSDPARVLLRPLDVRDPSAWRAAL